MAGVNEYGDEERTPFFQQEEKKSIPKASLEYPDPTKIAQRTPKKKGEPTETTKVNAEGVKEPSPFFKKEPAPLEEGEVVVPPPKPAEAKKPAKEVSIMTETFNRLKEMKKTLHVAGKGQSKAEFSRKDQAEFDALYNKIKAERARKSLEKDLTKL